MDYGYIVLRFKLKERSIPASGGPNDRINLNIPHVVQSSTFSVEDWLKMNEVSQRLSG